MNLYTGIVVYLLIWWTVLFAVLPWQVKHEKDPVVGHATGAPVNPRLKFKFIVTSCISALIWLIVFVLIKMQIVDFRAIAMNMIREDYGE